MGVVAKRPIQVYLRPDQLAALRALAKRRGVSIAELMRQGADRVLAEVDPSDDPLWDLVGIVDDDGPEDMAEHHDAYLAGADGVAERR